MRVTKAIERNVTGVWHQRLNDTFEIILPLRWFLPRAGAPGTEQRVYDRGDRVTALHVACALNAVTHTANHNQISILM